MESTGNDAQSTGNDLQSINALAPPGAVPSELMQGAVQGVLPYPGQGVLTLDSSHKAEVCFNRCGHNGKFIGVATGCHMLHREHHGAQQR